MRMLCLILAALPVFAADWNPRGAADYLDARQKEWFAWAPANANAKPCVSCHGGLTYLLARPALRRVLHKTEPTRYETGLVDSLRARLAKRAPKDMFPTAVEPHLAEGAGVESILAAMFVRTPEAFDRMWSLQTDGGGFPWFSLNLEPWEQPKSAYFGAAVAALAAGRSETPQTARLRAYLAREFSAQPLHHRLMAVWSGALSTIARASTLDELWRKQSADGGWTLDALGPWIQQPDAPPVSGTNAYATAFAAVALLKSGVSPSDPRVERALAWLRSHQDPKGYWDAVSMNKRRPPESIPAGFMRDAATAWAALALCEAR
jgi:squalene-hopene/tetraprenyl-beta-curcumene cyclase